MRSAPPAAGERPGVDATTWAVTGRGDTCGQAKTTGAQGDGTHRLPVKAKLRKAIGKEAGATVRVRIDERIG